MISLTARLSRSAPDSQACYSVLGAFLGKCADVYKLNCVRAKQPVMPDFGKCPCQMDRRLKPLMELAQAVGEYLLQRMPLTIVELIVPQSMLFHDLYVMLGPTFQDELMTRERVHDRLYILRRARQRRHQLRNRLLGKSYFNAA
ncbi:E9 [Francolinus leucoscepus papillomavirus 1]|uniref:E9 n=1 Tax=Francolinus leucoscepus papillomavirus 1 TaxID=485362 RepID=C6ZDA1_9PAPI|nr:E9 [Francolinus leucoscepus papillomavirus 1]ABX61086.1 E9 [Francolinus leucoscepus papillomavirus 1]